MLREELYHLQEPGSYVGEVIKQMGNCLIKPRVLVKVGPDGKYVVDVDPSVNIEDIKPNCRVALRNDSYVLHRVLPNQARGGRSWIARDLGNELT